MLPADGQQELGEGVELLQGYINQHQVLFEHLVQRAEGRRLLLTVYLSHAHVNGHLIKGCNQHRASHAADWTSPIAILFSECGDV
jgi:hypothetical protein